MIAAFVLARIGITFEDVWRRQSPRETTELVAALRAVAQHDGDATVDEMEL